MHRSTGSTKKPISNARKSPPLFRLRFADTHCRGRRFCAQGSDYLPWGRSGLRAGGGSSKRPGSVRGNPSASGPERQRSCVIVRDHTRGSTRMISQHRCWTRTSLLAPNRSNPKWKKCVFPVFTASPWLLLFRCPGSLVWLCGSIVAAWSPLPQR